MKYCTYFVFIKKIETSVKTNTFLDFCHKKNLVFIDRFVVNEGSGLSAEAGVSSRQLLWLFGSQSAVSICSLTHLSREEQAVDIVHRGLVRKSHIKDQTLSSQCVCVSVCVHVCINAGLASRCCSMFYSVSCYRHGCHSLSESSHSAIFKGCCRLHIRQKHSLGLHTHTNKHTQAHLAQQRTVE